MLRCVRAFDADVAAILQGEGDGDFLAHAASCADCAAELRVWRELDTMLRTGAADATSHPEPEALVAFVDGAASLDVATRGAIERHVATCRPCADEVRSLGALDPARLAAEATALSSPGSARSPVAAPAVAAPTSDVLPSVGGRLARVLWHPAFAYALVVLLLVPLLREQLPRVAEETRAVDARREAPAAPAPAAKAEAKGPHERDRAFDATDLPLAVGRAEPAAPPAQPAIAERAAPRPQELARRASPAPATRENERPSDAGRVAGELGASGSERRVETAAGDRAFGAAGSSADALRDATGAAPGAAVEGPPPTILALEPQRPAIFAPLPAGRPVVLRITRPTDLVRGPLAVTVRGRANQRVLERRADDGAGAIAIDIPPDWLVPGDYAVTLQPLDVAAHAAGAPTIVGFAIRAPTAAR